MFVKRVEVVVSSLKNALPFPLQSCDSWMVVKENPNRKQQKKKKNKKQNKTKKKVFLRKGVLKYAANLQENTHPEVQFQ